MERKRFMKTYKKHTWEVTKSTGLKKSSDSSSKDPTTVLTATFHTIHP